MKFEMLSDCKKTMKLKTIIILGAVIVGSGVLLGCSCGIRTVTSFASPDELKFSESVAYQRGVNDALDATMLLDLEQRMTSTNRNWGDMAKVVCSRLDVKRKQP